MTNYLYNNEIHIMKYGLYILRKFISQDTIYQEDSTYSKIIDVKLLNFLCHLLDYPDITVKVIIIFQNIFKII